MLRKKYSLRAIARTLKRSVSSISDEIRRNKVSGEYDPHKAQFKSHQRRKNAKYQGMKIAARKKIKQYVDMHLYDDLTPEAIAGRIKYQDKHMTYVSGDSIRRYIDSPYGRKVAWYRIQEKRKRKRRGKRSKVTQLSDRTFIDKRPIHIGKRRLVGHGESDFIVSGRSGRGILLVVTDRKLRVSFIEKIIHTTILNVHGAFQKIKQSFPELRSITTDNDILLQHHKELERLLSIKIYFCHPYSSWEKGTIENTNKYIRRDILKGSDISKYSYHFIKKLEVKLNRRPMKILNYKTPQEMLDVHRQRKKRLSALRMSR